MKNRIEKYGFIENQDYETCTFLNTHNQKVIEEITGYSRNTIQHFKLTAEKLSPDTRLPHLSYSHHREVSSLNPEQQKEFLQKADMLSPCRHEDVRLLQ